MQAADNEPKSINKKLRRHIAKANSGAGDGQRDIVTTADIIPFPPSQKFIADELMMVPEPAVAAKWLACVVRGRRKWLRELGVSLDRIAADATALEAAFGIAQRRIRRTQRRRHRRQHLGTRRVLINARCPLSGVKRTLIGGAPMSAPDPKRTWGP